MGLGRSFRRAFRSFDDHVLHPVKEAAQKTIEIPFKLATESLQAVLPDKLEGSWTQIPQKLNPGNALEKSYWEKPAETFVNNFDTMSTVAPRTIRPYAPQITGAVLSAFNPFAGAAFNTIYAAGKNQQQGGDWSWSDVGKDAAVNFGTAAVANWAKNAQAANAAKSTADTANQSAQFASTGAQGGSGATQTAAVRNATSMQPNYGTYGPLTQAQTAATAGRSASMVPQAISMSTANQGAMQAFGNAAKTGALNSSATATNQALTATLKPEMNQPIAGIGSLTEDLQANEPYKYGNLLSAFGGGVDFKTANPTGVRLTQEDLDKMYGQVDANTYLQTQEKNDRYVPAGQVAPTDNTPYGTSLANVYRSQEQAKYDLAQQAENYNRYNAVLDSNSWLKPEDMQSYIDYANAPDTTKLPSNLAPLPNDVMSWFKGLQPIQPIY